MSYYHHAPHASPPARRKSFLVFALLMAVVIGVILLTQVFVVKDVKTSETRFRTAQEVVALAGIQRGESMLLLNEQQMMKRINQDTFLECLSIQLQFPDTLYIELREREPFASLTWLGLFTIVDETGHVLIRSDQIEDTWSHLPVVTGLEISGIREGAVIQTRKESQVEQMELLFKALVDGQVLDRIKEIDVTDANDFYVVTQDDMKVSLGSLDMMEQKLAIWRVVEGQLTTEEKTKATLDVSTGNSGDYRPMPVVSTIGGADPIRNPDSEIAKKEAE